MKLLARSRRESTPPDAWNRWLWAWHLAFYALLVLGMVAALFDRETTGEGWVWVISLTLLLGGLYAIIPMRHPEWDQQPTMLIYVVSAMVLWFLLAGLHPAYFMLLFVLYPQVFSLLPMRLAIPAALVLTVLIVWLQIDQAPASAGVFVLIGIVTVVFGVLFALWINAVIHQSEERKRLIEELEQTRKELAAEERRAGVLEERGRLAREIHDTLAQSFISIVTHLEAAEEQLPPGMKPVQRHLDQARRTARENLIEARRLVAALRPEILENSSLLEALRRLAGRWSEASGIPAEVAVIGDDDQIPQDLQVTLLRVAQEALSNVGKHARAKRVTLTLTHMGDLVSLDVYDDGAGFDPESAPDGSESGFGLKAMRERVERLGGTLFIESAPDVGTTLTVQLPLGVTA